MQPLPPKKEVALALLERSSVHLHLDPRIAGVVVPLHFRKQPQLVLQIGLNMPVPIPDLRLDEEGMSCTLSFNRTPFYCVVPWSSVFAIVGDDAKGMVWPDDVPAEIARQTQVRPVESAPPPKASWKPEAVSNPKAETAGKGKRPRKRAPLVAVADGEAPTGKSAKGARSGQPAQLSSPPVLVPAAPASRPAGGSRKKRELPPYLRVVK